MRIPGIEEVARKRVTYDQVERIAMRLSFGGMKIGLHQDFRTGHVQAFVDGKPLDHSTHERDHYDCLMAVKAVGRGHPQIPPVDPMHESDVLVARGKAWMKKLKSKTPDSQ